MKLGAVIFVLTGLLVYAKGGPCEAASRSAIRLRVGYSSISGSAVIPWIAVDKGIFGKYDLEVELIYIGSGTSAMQSLLSGTTQIGVQGIEPVMRVNAQGSDTVMIAGLVTKPPFSMIVRPEIREPKDLKGKAMGVSRYGSTTDLLLRLTLEKWGLRPEVDVAIIQMGGVPPILSGMQSKTIVGGPISLPTLAIAKQEGFRELVDLSEVIPDYQAAGVVTRRSFIRQNPEVVRNFIRSIGEAIAVFKTNLAFSKTIIKERLKIDDPLVQEETQRTYINYVPRVPYPSRPGIALAKSFMDKTEPSVRPLSIDDQLDVSFVRELEQSGFFNGLYQSLR
jgi:NitT/TauT family transport system substrate-binding protein